MAYISGFDRNQSFLFSLNDFISDNNPVRLIDLFVDLLDLPSLGFISHSPSSPGQRPYRSSDLLKLHLYGYVNGIRSSRKLAAESSVDSDPDAIISFNQSISHYKDKLAQFHSLKDSMISNSLSQVSITDPDSRFSCDKFSFLPDKNIYICPAGHELHFSRNLTKKKSPLDSHASIVGFEYSCSDCFHCPFFGKCTTSLAGRKITRNFFQDILDVVQKRFDDNPHMYTLRKCVVEHPFGTIKRSLGYTYFLRRGLDSVRAEATLICLAYDINRVCNIAPFSFLKDKLKEFFLAFSSFFSLFFSSLLKKTKSTYFFLFCRFCF